MKYRARRDIPKFARLYHTLSCTKLADIILRERNKLVTPQAVTMWLRRNPEVHAQLKKEIIAEELPKLEVVETIFSTGTFEELKTVKSWIQEMEDRHLGKTTVQGHVSALKRLCRGHELEPSEWTFKHPDRLDLDEARDYIRKRRNQGKGTHAYRVAVRDFLLSKGMAAGKKISGAKVAGKYKKLHLPRPVIREFLEGVKQLSYECYAIDLFEAKTGTRIEAVLRALIDDIVETDDTRVITVYDKGRKSIYPEGHDWEKQIDQELWEALIPVIQDREVGTIFNMNAPEVRKINKAVLEEMISKYQDRPKIQQLLKMALNIPTHWLRHQFFQVCLHKTEWNYGVCAALGGSTVKSLEESYGMPPDAIVKKWGRKIIPQI